MHTGRVTQETVLYSMFSPETVFHFKWRSMDSSSGETLLQSARLLRSAARRIERIPSRFVWKTHGPSSCEYLLGCDWPHRRSPTSRESLFHTGHRRHLLPDPSDRLSSRQPRFDGLAVENMSRFHRTSYRSPAYLRDQLLWLISPLLEWFVDRRIIRKKGRTRCSHKKQ